jgi:hypothetical protein
MDDPTHLLRQTNFTLVDWVIVILYPLISVGIGLYVRKLIVNMSERDSPADSPHFISPWPQESLPSWSASLDCSSTACAKWA